MTKNNIEFLNSSTQLCENWGWFIDIESQLQPNSSIQNYTVTIKYSLATIHEEASLEELSHKELSHKELSHKELSHKELSHDVIEAIESNKTQNILKVSIILFSILVYANYAFL
jgi:hypothetical protein